MCSPTLLVILGPFWASDDWAKKRNVAVKISKIEITSRCKLAMVYKICYFGNEPNQNVFLFFGSIGRGK